MTPAELGYPAIIVGLLSLLGVVLSVTATRRTATYDESNKFLASLLAEVKSLRDDSNVTEGRLDTLSDKLIQTQRELLVCLADKGTQGVVIEELRRRVRDLEERHPKGPE